MSEITLKLKYQTENSSRILEMIKNYNSIFNLTYNFMFENGNSSTKSILNYVNSKNNLLLDTYFKNGAIYDCKGEISKNKEKKIIFGGKKLFLERQNNKISKEEYKIAKLRPLQIVGAAFNKGNCKFQIISKSEILFKPNSKEHFTLRLESVGRNYEKKLEALKVAQDNKELPIAYKLSKDYVFVSFDNSIIEKYRFKPTKKLRNRIFAIDLNPNYIGWSVVDWKSENQHQTIKSGVISLKALNDYDNSLKNKGFSSESSERKYISNKRNTECIEIAYELCKLANHYRCEVFGLEDLKIKSSDKNKGKRFNKLCNNQWCRNKLVSAIEKLNDLYEIKTQKVMANYSSFEGNLIYRKEKLPDMCLSSIEIGRRAYEFYHQYVLKDKNKEKNIIFDKLENVQNRIEKSLEELDYKGAWASLSELYYSLKKVKCKYRFSIEDAIKHHLDSFSSKNFTKSFTSYICFD